MHFIYLLNFELIPAVEDCGDEECLRQAPVMTAAFCRCRS